VTLPWWPATRRWALRWELVNDAHSFEPLASKVLSFSFDFLAHGQAPAGGARPNSIAFARDPKEISQG
jgi:hypothetical protein